MRILILQRRFVLGNRLLLRVVSADMVAVSASVDVGTPGVVFRVIADPFHATLAVAPNTMMASCLFLADDLQVFASTVETIVIGKYNLEAYLISASN